MAKGWILYANEYKRGYLGQAITLYRDALKLTFGQLTARTGINKGTLKHAAAGSASLPPERRAKIVEVLLESAAEQGRSVDGDALRALAGLGGIDRRDFNKLLVAATAGLLLPSPADTPSLLQIMAAPTTQPVRISHHADPDWREWLELGHMQSERTEHLKARRSYELAANAAEPGGARALALAYQAYSWRRLNNLEHVWTCSLASFDELRTAGGLPEQTASPKMIETRFRNDPAALEAFAINAQVRGHALMVEERFGQAKTSFLALDRTGQAMGNPSLRAEAQRLLGRILIEEGTAVDDKGLYYVTDRVALGRAVGWFSEASLLRPDNDHQALAHDLLHKARALKLLGRTTRDEDSTAEFESEESFGTIRPRANLYVDQWRWIIAEGRKRGLAEDRLIQARDIALDIQSDSLLAKAFSGLGEFFVSGNHVRDHNLAALLAWPFSLQTREGRRMTVLYGLAGGSSGHARRAVATMAYPLDVLPHLVGFTATRVGAVLDHIDATIG